MRSPKQIAASRANGARSRGPVTPEGKKVASQNAFRHGLSAHHILLDCENAEGFEKLIAAHIERFQPVDAVEMGIVEEMVVSDWRLQRVRAIEARLLQDRIDAMPPGEEISRLAKAFEDLAASPALGLLHRYEARLDRMHRRAIQTLILLRKTNLPNEPEPSGAGLQTCPPGEAEGEPVTPAPEPAPPEPTPEPNRFAKTHEFVPNALPSAQELYAPVGQALSPGKPF